MKLPSSFSTIPGFLRVVFTTPIRRCKLMGTSCLLPTLRDGWAMVRGLSGVGSANWAEQVVRVERGCKRCPIYDRDRQACGTTRIKCAVLVDGELREMPLGCGCHIPTKASIDDARCWLDQLGPYRPIIITPGHDDLQKRLDELEGPMWPI